MGYGSLNIIGLGPDGDQHLTLAARAALEQSTVVVGYEGYLRQLAPWLRRAFRPFPIGAERERVLAAIALARGGARVALVSSGDAGIYGLASLALETLAAQGWEAEREFPVAVLPGVSALSAAAALLGAPLGHDFAVVSLSDLLTPWPVIARRLAAAAAADFVLVLYNPASRGRCTQLTEARDLLLAHRAPDTAVGVVRNAYRPEQRVLRTTLGALPLDEIDMLTTVVVGASTTRPLGPWLVTPRGYGTVQAGPVDRTPSSPSARGERDGG
ncbi:MAG: precorrin-3B C(17)-methyltransferase [Chloroflexi bacterium]|nr:precorrin-3B C(17)-methyltransferase [Chloroflexota bacterium]